MIEKIKKSPLNSQASSVYNFNEFSLTELLNKFFSTINECVDVSNTSLDFLRWLKGEGLSQETVKELNNMYNDGRLELLIGEYTGNLKQQVNNINIEIENLDNQMEELNTKINDNINILDNKINVSNLNLETVSNFSKDETVESLESQLESGNPLITKNINVDKTIQLVNTVNMKATNNKLKKASFNGNILNIKSSNNIIKELRIEDKNSSNTNSAFNIMNSENNTISNNIVETNGMFLTVNEENVNNINISNNLVKADNYGVLINENSSNSKNAILNGNIIYSNKGDGIALNNPPNNGQNPDDVFQNASVVGNVVETSNDSTSTYSGFGVSVADTHNVTVVGNIIPYARTEGLHYEGTAENCVFSSNVSDKCKNNGMGIINIKRNYEGSEFNGDSVIINNNIFKKLSQTKIGTGIYNVYNSSGVIDNNIINENYIKGFDTGLWLDGVSINITDKNVIKNCNIGIKGYANSRVIGENLIIDTPSLIDTVNGNGLIVDKVYSNTKPTDIIKNGGSNGRYVTTKGFYYRDKESFSLKNGINIIPLFPKPNLLQGKLFIEIYGNNSQDTIHFVTDLVFDGNNFTLNNTLFKGRNAFNEKTYSLIIDNNNVCLSVDTGVLTDSTFRQAIEFDGYYMK